MSDLKAAIMKALRDADYLPGNLSEKADRISNDIVDEVKKLIAAEREACASQAIQSVEHHYGYSGEIFANEIRRRPV